MEEEGRTREMRNLEIVFNNALSSSVFYYPCKALTSRGPLNIIFTF